MKPFGEGKLSTVKYKNNNNNFCNVDVRKINSTNITNFVCKFTTISRSLLYSEQIYKIVDTLHLFLMTQEISQIEDENDVLSFSVKLKIHPINQDYQPYFKWCLFTILIDDLKYIGYDLTGTQDLNDLSAARQRALLLELLLNKVMTQDIVTQIVNDGRELRGRLVEEADGNVHYEDFDENFLMDRSFLIDWINEEIETMTIIIPK